MKVGVVQKSHHLSAIHHQGTGDYLLFTRVGRAPGTTRVLSQISNIAECSFLLGLHSQVNKLNRQKRKADTAFVVLGRCGVCKDVTM